MFATDRLLFEFPEKTLALTYDDGPGPSTLEIAEFLHGRGIPATFFVVGNHVRERREVVGKVASLGHLIGNHTDTHTPLPKFESEPEKLAKEVMDADRELEQFVGRRRFFLRTPGGHWGPSFAQALNRCTELGKYDGPVNWDIAHGDYEIGSSRPPRSAGPVYTFEECEHNYLKAIQEQGRGIVLLHDWSADGDDVGEELRSKNRTLELTKVLVPQLAAFRFVPLDQLQWRILA